MILESISPIFLQFKSNYVMDKLNYNMMQLLNEFKSSSKEKGKENDANVVEAQPSSLAKRWRKAQEEQEKKGSKEKKPKGK